MATKTTTQGRTNQPKTERRTSKGDYQAAPSTDTSTTPNPEVASKVGGKVASKVSRKLPSAEKSKLMRRLSRPTWKGRRFDGVRSTIEQHDGWSAWASMWFVAVIVSWFHVALTNWSIEQAAAGTTAESAIYLSVLSIPVVLTFIGAPQSRGRLWRWPVLWLVMGTTLGETTLMIFLFGQAYLLHRFWVSEKLFGYRWEPRSGLGSRNTADAAMAADDAGTGSRTGWAGKLTGRTNHTKQATKQATGQAPKRRKQMPKRQNRTINQETLDRGPDQDQEPQ